MRDNTAQNAQERGPLGELLLAAAPGFGFVSEMFCSVQGEGPMTGERQIFLRTAGCTETCSWCDTVYSKVQTPRFVIHEKDKRTLDNPLAADVVVAEALAFAGSHSGVKTVSVTGGEPLEQPAFTEALARGLNAGGMRVYLETAGMHADAFARVLSAVSVVAMDIKLPSALGHDAWNEHRAFLEVIRDTKFDPECGGTHVLFVKVVIDRRSTLDEVARAARLVAGVSRKIPLVLQPESGVLLSARAPRENAVAIMEFARSAQERALDVLDSVRIMPQSHKILGLR